MSRINLSAVVSRQLPEHIREDYPTFVAFVEAYYEYLQSQGVDFATIRDIDRTLESFVDQFRKELAYNLPNITQDERFLLQNVKDQYLAKGSEGSYKLLFKLLFGKEVELIYPGRSMLRASDGRWNQEISLFAKIDYGNPVEVVGKLVDIQTQTRILRVLIDRRQDIVGEVDRIVLIDPTLQVYEFFLDKKFFGNVSAGDKIRYRDEFQATILPTTQQLNVTQAGRNFRLGQVFELRSGTGTGALMKVTAVTNTGGIKYAEIIKFGIGYAANFAVSVLANNSVTSIGSATKSFSTLVQESTYSSAGVGTINASSSNATVTGSGTDFGQVGGPDVGDELWSTDSTPKVIGVIKSIASSTSLTLVDVPSQYENPISGTYTGSFTFRNVRSIGSLYAPGDVQSYTLQSNIVDRTLGFDEQGYINLADYVTHEYVDGTYAGSLLREFSLNFRNAQNNAEDPAIIEINLGALAKYPGYFETNNGFLNDSIYIQDSKYYQAFSYVLKIDERLATYSSAVKTMIHPAGMALFGEFNITNNYDLSIDLESLVKSLGFRINSEISDFSDLITFNVSKTLSDSLNTPSDNILRFNVSKPLSDFLDTPSDNILTLSTSKPLSDFLDTPSDNILTLSTSKPLSDFLDTPSDNISIQKSVLRTLEEIQFVIDSTSLNVSKPLSDSQDLLDTTLLSTSKPLSDSQSVIDTTSLNVIKSLSDSQSVIDTTSLNVIKSLSDSQSVIDASSLNVIKSLSDSQDLLDTTLLSTSKPLSDFLDTPSDNNLALSTSKPLSDSQDLLDTTLLSTSKPLSDFLDTPSDNILTLITTKYIQDTLNSQTETGYVGLNSYAGQDMFATEYSVGSRASTFTTP
jgi:hypothetical protein